MIFKNLFRELWSYSKPLFIFVVFVIIIHLFYNFQFARLAHLVDHQKPIPNPIAFEAFPFVVYNMYSGKIDDWNKYSYLKIEADGEEVILTDLAVIQEDQFVNPSQKFLSLQSKNFNDEVLFSFLQFTFDSSKAASRVYDKVSNQIFINNEEEWGKWIKRYLSRTLKKEIAVVKFFECAYQYNSSGRPEIIEQKLMYQFQ